MRAATLVSFLFICLATAGATRAEGLALTVKLPEGAKPSSAAAVARELELESAGKVQGRAVTFDGLLPDTPYDLRVTLEGGTILQGVDLGWYNEEGDEDEEAAEENSGEEAGPAAGLSDEDRRQIQDVLNVPRFYNKCDVLALGGGRKRATALVRLVRDKDFYAGAGQIIWRIELWYFKNQFGGWEAVSQQNRILRRERFKTKEQYEKETARIRWVPALGGIRLADEQVASVLELKELPKDTPETAAPAPPSRRKR